MSEKVGLVSAACFVASTLCAIWVSPTQWGATATLFAFITIGALTYPESRR